MTKERKGTEMDESSPVELYAYDLSQGMAKSLSVGLLGTHIDAIWHTSVIVYGVEYYYGQGIFSAVPGTTPHGTPIKKIDMGITHLPKEVVEEYINELRSEYTAEKYHLLDNNCNNFSNDVCNFLVGKSIPSFITGLPQEFLNTPFGEAMLPMIENMFGKSRHSSSSSSSFQPHQIPPHEPPTTVQQSAIITGITTNAQLDNILSSNRCVVVDFTSKTCGPCQYMDPEFKSVIEEKSEKSGAPLLTPVKKGTKMVVGVKVETGVAFEISSRYNVTATPTFMFFLDGVKFSEFKGADVRELKSSVDLLLYTAYPPHPHTRVNMPTLNSLCAIPSTFTANTPYPKSNMILFSTSSSIDQIFEKLKQFIGEVEAWDKNDKDRVIGVLDELRGQMRKQKGVSVQVPSGLNDAIDAILIHLSEKNVFPLIDILRILILEESVQKQFADTIFPKIMMVLHKFGGGAESIDEVPKPTALMTLRLASNILASQHLANIVLSETLTLSIPTPTDAQMRIAIPYRAVSTALVVESLLSSELNIRQTAASFALNMAIFDAFQRSSDDGGDGEGEDEWVEWRCEVVAALIKALQDETGEEIELRLMASISILLRYSSSSVVQLAKVLELSDILKKKKGGVESATDTGKNSKIDKLAKEMIDLLNWEI